MQFRKWEGIEITCEKLIPTLSYLLIGLRNEAGDAAVSIQKLLKLLVADDEPLGLSQGFLSCILAVNQQALEHLNTSTQR